MSVTGLGPFLQQPANGGLSPAQRAQVKAWSQRQPANGGLSVAQQIQAGGQKSKGGIAHPKPSPSSPSTPAAPAAPGPGGSAPNQSNGGKSLTGSPNIEDPTYFAGLAANNLTRNTGLGELATRRSRLDEDTTTTLGQLAHNLVMTKGNTAETLNKSNLFDSSARLHADQGADYTNTQDVNHVNTEHDRGAADIGTAFTRLIEQYGNKGVDPTSYGQLSGEYGTPTEGGDYGTAGAGLYADAGTRWQSEHPTGTPAGMAYDANGNLVPVGYNDTVDGGKSIHDQGGPDPTLFGPNGYTPAGVKAAQQSKGGTATPKGPSTKQPADGGLSPAQKAGAAKSKGGMVKPK